MAAAGEATAARWPCDWPVCGEYNPSFFLCDFWGLLGICVFCVKCCAVFRDWKGGLLVLCENGAKNGSLGCGFG